MKTEVKTVEKEKSVLPYPKLMISNSGQIVLMIRNGTGVNVNGVAFGAGHYSTDWNMSYFKDLPSDQQVILQND